MMAGTSFATSGDSRTAEALDPVGHIGLHIQIDGVVKKVGQLRVIVNTDHDKPV